MRESQQRPRRHECISRVSIAPREASLALVFFLLICIYKYNFFRSLKSTSPQSRNVLLVSDRPRCIEIARIHTQTHIGAVSERRTLCQEIEVCCHHRCSCYRYHRRFSRFQTTGPSRPPRRLACSVGRSLACRFTVFNMTEEQ